MAIIKTENNPGETLSNHEVLLRMADRLDALTVQVTGRLDHLDAGVHDIQQKISGLQEFIDAHRPALARGLAMMDPGSRLRAVMTRKGSNK